MKRFFALAFLVLAVSARADSRLAADGREEALRICRSMTFDNDIERCMGIVQHARYFDRAALPVCNDMGFDNRKTECLSDVADKTYLEGEIEICAKQPFETRRLECMRRSGTPYQPGQMVDVGYLKGRLRFALDSLRAGDQRAADQALAESLGYLDQIP